MQFMRFLHYLHCALILSGVEIKALFCVHADTWPQAMGIQASPPNVAAALRQRAELVDDIWHAAGDTSTDYNWYTKRGLLAGERRLFPMVPPCMPAWSHSAYILQVCQQYFQYPMCIVQRSDVGQEQVFMAAKINSPEGLRHVCRRLYSHGAVHADGLLPRLCRHLAVAGQAPAGRPAARGSCLRGAAKHCF